MTATVNELQVFAGGVRVPAVATRPLATDGNGNLVAAVRASSLFSTAALVSGTSEEDNVTLFSICKCLAISTNRPARVRAYSQSAFRAADLSRPATLDPYGNAGCLLEIVTMTGLLGLDLTPAVTLHNLDNPVAPTIYWTTQNLDTNTGVVTVTLTLLQEE
jgi:hypothetical protein